jgi:hypothetical protein
MELNYESEYWLDKKWKVDFYVESPADLVIEING